MNKETLEMLQALAAKLGTTAEHLWSVLIRQAYVSFATDLFFYVLAGIVIYELVKWIRECLDAEQKQNAKDPENDNTGYIILMIVLITVGLTIITAVLIHIPDTITKIMNPEYWALMEIFDAIKGVK